MILFYFCGILVRFICIMCFKDVCYFVFVSVDCDKYDSIDFSAFIWFIEKNSFGSQILPPKKQTFLCRVKHLCNFKSSDFGCTVYALRDKNLVWIKTVDLTGLYKYIIWLYITCQFRLKAKLVSKCNI